MERKSKEDTEARLDDAAADGEETLDEEEALAVAPEPAASEPLDEGLEDDLDDFDGDDEDFNADVALTNREQSARSLAIRRALEQRIEQRRLKEDIDYLDYDLDD